MKKLFFVFSLYILIFPITAMELPADNHRALGTPARPIPVQNVHIHAAAISNLLGQCTDQIFNVHTIFSGEYGKSSQPKIQVKSIQELLGVLLEPVFSLHFKPARTKRFTPDCKKSLKTHLKDIAGDSPKTFLKKGSADFIKSVDQDDYYTFDTHEQNTFFIQEMLLDPEYGFGLYRSYTNTLEGPRYGEYNVVKLLGGGNPETHSGPVELHHVYQNSEVVTIVPYSEHKGKTAKYHRSKKDSKIDRASTASEFYYIKKLIGLLQIAKMCSRILKDCHGLSESTIANMQYIDSYRGNFGLIENPGAELLSRQKFTVEMAFNPLRNQPPAIAEEAAIILNEESLQGHTDNESSARSTPLSDSESSIISAKNSSKRILGVLTAPARKKSKNVEALSGEEENISPNLEDDDLEEDSLAYRLLGPALKNKHSLGQAAGSTQKKKS